MAICSSGISEQKPGTTDDVYLTALILAGIAQKFAPWLEPFIGYATAELVLHLPTFCAVDPPADPGITAADILGLVTLGPGPLTQGAADRVTQLLQRFAWFSFCHCATVTTPAPPAGPAAPTGLPSINPTNFISPPTSTPCQVYGTFTGSNDQSGNFIKWIGDFNSTPVVTVPLPAGATMLAFDSTVTTVSGTPDKENVEWRYFSSGGVVLGTFTQLVGPDSSLSWTSTIPANSVAIWAISQKASTITGVLSQTITISAYCNGGGPGRSVAACCPPDLLAVGMLKQVLETVTLLQRQIAPFAYVPGTVHTGLSGDNLLTVTGLIGLQVDVTTLPGRAGLVVGDPTTYFDLGWINLGTADGFTHRDRITSQHYLTFPPDMGAMTRVGYSIPADTVVTITELLREP